MGSNGNDVTIQLEDNTRGTLTMFIEQSPTDFFFKINETRIPAHYFTTNKYSEYVSRYFVQNRFILGMEVDLTVANTDEKMVQYVVDLLDKEKIVIKDIECYKFVALLAFLDISPSMLCSFPENIFKNFGQRSIDTNRDKINGKRSKRSVPNDEFKQIAKFEKIELSSRTFSALCNPNSVAEVYYLFRENHRLQDGSIRKYWRCYQFSSTGCDGRAMTTNINGIEMAYFRGIHTCEEGRRRYGAPEERTSTRSDTRKEFKAELNEKLKDVPVKVLKKSTTKRSIKHQQSVSPKCSKTSDQNECKTEPKLVTYLNEVENKTTQAHNPDFGVLLDY